MKIIFTDTVGISKKYYPTPASSSIPKWYKDLESYKDNLKKPNLIGNRASTIKRCMPVFDAISAGYIIYTYTDLYISKTTEGSHYQWPSLNPIGFHPVDQAPNHPDRNGLLDTSSYPKWKNVWAIKTPKGYSCLITTPMHRESPFKIFDGIVDTDFYDAPINFPFVLKDWDFEGLIEAGTPIAQIIPFKREFYKMEIGNEKQKKEQEKTTNFLLTSFFDSYKKKFRQNKEYR